MVTFRDDPTLVAVPEDLARPGHEEDPFAGLEELGGIRLGIGFPVTIPISSWSTGSVI